MGITIFPSKEKYKAGEELTAIVKLDLGKPIKVNAIHATLICQEKHKKNEVRNIPLAEIEERKRLGLYASPPYVRSVEIIEEHERFREEKKIAGGDVYQNQEFRVVFKLPNDAKPTSYIFGHDNRIVVWKIQVKVDIPFALDINASKDIEVGEL